MLLSWATSTVDIIEVPAYSLTIMAGQGGSISKGNDGQYKAGTKVTISALPDSGYIFDRWISSDGGSFDNEYGMETVYHTLMKISTYTILHNIILAKT